MIYKLATLVIITKDHGTKPKCPTPLPGLKFVLGGASGAGVTGPAALATIVLASGFWAFKV